MQVITSMGYLETWHSPSDKVVCIVSYDVGLELVSASAVMRRVGSVQALSEIKLIKHWIISSKGGQALCRICDNINIFI